MTVSRFDIVAEARTWLGTRFQHQGRVKGIGVDCSGLVCGVGVALGLLDPGYASQDNVREFVGYPKLPPGRQMAEACARVLTKISIAEAGIGDVYLMALMGQPQHVALITDHGIIHAHAQMRKVVEHRIDDEWQARICGAYRYPGMKI